VLAIGGVMLAILAIVGFICTVGQESIITAMQKSLRPKMLAEWGPRIVDVKMKAIDTNFGDFVSGIWRSVVFVIGILAAIFLALNRRIAAWILACIMVVGVLIDQIPFMAKFLPATGGPDSYYRADGIVTTLQQDDSIYRVFPTPYYDHAQDCYLLYHNIQSTGGYIPNPLRRYQDFIGAQGSVMYRPFSLIPMEGGSEINYNAFHKRVDMLNCKYIIGPNLPDDLTQVPPEYHQLVNRLNTFFARYRIVYRTEQNTVYFNDHVLPRAYMVGDHIVLDEPDILDYIQSGKFNPRHTVILEEDIGLVHPDEPLPLIEAQVAHFSANEITCTVSAPYDGIFVLGDNWHPDWTVFVDGEEKECLQANYIFRAVAVSKGAHEVRFAYRSEQFNLGKVITIIALFLTIALGAVLIIRNAKPLHSK
jgi:hypothetical protein